MLQIEAIILPFFSFIANVLNISELPLWLQDLLRLSVSSNPVQICSIDLLLKFLRLTRTCQELSLHHDYSTELPMISIKEYLFLSTKTWIYKVNVATQNLGLFSTIDALKKSPFKPNFRISRYFKYFLGGFKRIRILLWIWGERDFIFFFHYLHEYNHQRWKFYYLYLCFSLKIIPAPPFVLASGFNILTCTYLYLWRESGVSTSPGIDDLRDLLGPC